MFTCSVVAINQTGDVGFGLAGYQIGRAELFQDTVVVVFINFPLIVDSEKRGVWWQTSKRRIDVVIHDLLMKVRLVPHILISSTHCKVIRLRRVDVDGVQPHLLVALLYNDQFTATKI